MKKESKPVVLTLDHKSLSRVKARWAQASGSVDEINVVNLIQLLKPDERIHFVNEAHRVLKAGGKFIVSAPWWASARAYSDLTFQWPPICEGWFYHLNKEWREANAPWGTKYKCDFDFGIGYNLHPQVATRNQEYVVNAITFWKESAQDIAVTLTKR